MAPTQAPLMRTSPTKNPRFSLTAAKVCLLVLGAVGIIGSAAGGGCSGDGGAVDLGEPTTSTENGDPLPPSNPGVPPSSGGKPDGGKPGKEDAGKDAGPPPPKPGDPCNDASKIFEAPCGKCGK